MLLLVLWQNYSSVLENKINKTNPDGLAPPSLQMLASVVYSRDCVRLQISDLLNYMCVCLYYSALCFSLYHFLPAKGSGFRKHQQITFTSFFPPRPCSVIKTWSTLFTDKYSLLRQH